MVSAQEYLPEAGDLVWLDFTPQAGREHAGRRPALVLSPRAYNAKTSLAIVCPITSQVKGYPFEVALPSGGRIGGVILSDHVKNLDSLENALEETMTVKITDSQPGAGTVYFNPFISERWESNPFKSEERFYPVDFGVPREQVLTLTLHYLPSYEVDELPAFARCRRARASRLERGRAAFLRP